MRLIVLATLLAGTPDAPDTREELVDESVIREKGTVGLVATGLLTAGAFGLTIARIGVMRSNCPLNDPGGDCSFDSAQDFSLMLPRISLSVASLAVAPGTGAMMGRHAAWRAATGSGPSRDPRRIAGAGGAFLATGALGIGAAAWMSVGLSRRCVDVQEGSDDAMAGERCMMRALPAWSMLSVSSFALSATGLGMLGYAGGYRRTRARIASVFALAGPGQIGVGVAGAF